MQSCVAFQVLREGRERGRRGRGRGKDGGGEEKAEEEGDMEEKESSSHYCKAALPDMELMVVMETHRQATVCFLMPYKDFEHSVIPESCAHGKWKDTQLIGSVWISTIGHQLLCSFNLVAV